jgi:hypothetical protein
VGQDVGLQGLPYRRAAGREDAHGRGGGVHLPGGRGAGQSRPGPPDARVQQGPARRTHPGRHASQRLGRDLRRRLRCPRATRRARLGAVYLGRDRQRRRQPADVQPAQHGRAPGLGG